MMPLVFVYFDIEAHPVHSFHHIHTAHLRNCPCLYGKFDMLDLSTTYGMSFLSILHIHYYVMLLCTAEEINLKTKTYYCLLIHQCTV
jgi:hypothetical protein